MKHIAMLKSGSKRPGGLEKFSQALATSFQKKGHKLLWLTSGPASSTTCPTLSLCKRSSLSWYHLASFDHHAQNYLQKNPFDIVFGLDRNSFQTHYRAGNGVHIAYLLERQKTMGFFQRKTLWLNPLHKLVLRLEKKTFESPDTKKIFVNSHWVKRQILEHYKTCEKKICVIHNGVDAKVYEEPFAQSCKKQRDFHHFIFVGHGWHRKGLAYALRGLSLLPQEPWRLTVVGHEKDEAYFVRLAKELGLLDRVHFLGPTKNIVNILQEADTLVLPTLYDPFANVSLEALAMGLFVVTSKSNGAAEILNETTGSVIEDIYSQESVAASLQKALYPRSRTLMREHSLRFSLEAACNKMVEETLDAS